MIQTKKVFLINADDCYGKDTLIQSTLFMNVYTIRRRYKPYFVF